MNDEAPRRPDTELPARLLQVRLFALRPHASRNSMSVDRGERSAQIAEEKRLAAEKLAAANAAAEPLQPGDIAAEQPPPAPH